MKASELVDLVEPLVGYEVAVEVAARIAREWGGRQETMYCAEAVTRLVRNREIADAADCGDAPEDIAKKHGISKKHALRIIEGFN